MGTIREELLKADKDLSKRNYLAVRKHQRLITVHLPYEWVCWLDSMVDEGRYPNRSEALRYMIRFYFDIFQIDYKEFK